MKTAYLFHKASCNNFCLHSSRSFMVNVLICKFTTAIDLFLDSDSFTHFIIAYHISLVNVQANRLHWVKCIQIRSFSCPCFSAFALDTEGYKVSLRIQSECGKIRTRKNSVFGYISHSVIYWFGCKTIK